jgi:hypothetical protein
MTPSSDVYDASGFPVVLCELVLSYATSTLSEKLQLLAEEGHVIENQQPACEPPLRQD